METNRQTITVTEPSNEVFKKISREAKELGITEYNIIIDKDKIDKYLDEVFNNSHMVCQLTPEEIERAPSFTRYGMRYFIK